MKISSKDGSKVMTVIASPGQGPDRSTEVSYTDTKVSAKPTMMVIGSISSYAEFTFHTFSRIFNISMLTGDRKRQFRCRISSQIM